MRIIGLVLLAAWTTWLYAPVLEKGQSAFVYEDAVTIQQNPMVLGMQPISLSTARWATWTTYRIDAWRSGQTSAFHQTNLGLHLLVGFLLWLFLRRWGASEFAAFLGTAAMLLHPITVESVAYITSRSELICALGVLAALLSAPLESERWTGWRLLGVLLGTYLAFGGKEMGIVTPALVWLIRPLPRWTWAVIALAALGVIVRLNDHHTVLGQGPYPVVQAFALQCVALLHGLRLLIWPVGLTVDADIAAAPMVWQYLSVGLVSIIAILAALARKRVPAFALAVMWFAIAIGPRLFADSWEFINEHQFYVPLMGLIIAGCLAVRQSSDVRVSTFDLNLGAGDSPC